MQAWVLIVAASIALAAAAPAPGRTDCHAELTIPIHFRSAVSNDVLALSIGDKTCMAGVPTIVVRTDKGQVIYSFVPENNGGPNPDFRRLTPTKANNQKFLQAVADRAMISSANLLPYDQVQGGDWNQDIKLTKDAYEKLRAATPPRPILTHTLGGESGATVVYDESLGKGIIVYDWWL